MFFNLRHILANSLVAKVIHDDNGSDNESDKNYNER